MSDSKKNQPPFPDELKTGGSKQMDRMHPICRFAKNKKKCEEFGERLSEASDNIVRRAAR